MRYLFIIVLASAALCFSGPDADARCRSNCRGRGRFCVRACARLCYQPAARRCCGPSDARQSGVPVGEKYRAELPLPPAPVADPSDGAPEPGAAPKLEIDINKPGGAK